MIKVKSYQDALRIAKVLARSNPAAAERYMEVFPRRNSIEQAAYENDIAP